MGVLCWLEMGEFQLKLYSKLSYILDKAHNSK